MEAVQSMNIYNDTPFLLEIKVTGNDPECMLSNPSVNRRIQITLKFQSQKIDIRAQDATGTVIKTATFYSKSDHSWIVNDDCIRRQKDGFDLFIADEITDSETATFHDNYSPNNEIWLKNNCNTIKCYPWNNKTCQRNRSIIDLIDEERIANLSLSSFSIRNDQLVQQSNIGIYNATPFLLQIEMYDKNKSLLFVSLNNPQIDRISTIISNVNYPFLSIYAMDSCGTTLKIAKFYSYKDYCWIIGDEYIRRRQKNASFYVADSCIPSQTEEYFLSYTDYLWWYCNDIRRYRWKYWNYCPETKCYQWDLCSRTELMLIESKERTKLTKLRQRQSIFSFILVDATHLSGFSSVTNRERKMITSFINNEITANIINNTAGPRSNITNNRANSREYPGLRLDLQGQDSDGLFNRFSIQLANRTFATVHVQMSLSNYDNDVVRNAFRQSLERGSDVWISDERHARRNDTNYTYISQLVAIGLLINIRIRNVAINKSKCIF